MQLPGVWTTGEAVREENDGVNDEVSTAALCPPHTRLNTLVADGKNQRCAEWREAAERSESCGATADGRRRGRKKRRLAAWTATQIGSLAQFPREEPAPWWRRGEHQRCAGMQGGERK